MEVLLAHPDRALRRRVRRALGKIAVYIRIQLDKDTNPKTLKARIKIPGGGVFEIADFEQLMAPTREQAEAQGTPFTGLVAKAVFAPMPIIEVGRIEAIVEIDGTEYLCGVLNLIPPPTTEASNSLPPPA